VIIIGSKIMTSISIFYYPEENIFKDSDGRAIVNMYKLVSPNRVFLFKHQKQSVEFVNYEYGLVVKLLYPINVIH
jgi:hypothetical protein